MEIPGRLKLLLNTGDYSMYSFLNISLDYKIQQEISLRKEKSTANVFLWRHDLSLLSCSKMRLPLNERIFTSPNEFHQHGLLMQEETNKWTYFKLPFINFSPENSACQKAKGRKYNIPQSTSSLKEIICRQWKAVLIDGAEVNLSSESGFRAEDAYNTDEDFPLHNAAPAIHAVSRIHRTIPWRKSITHINTFISLHGMALRHY